MKNRYLNEFISYISIEKNLSRNSVAAYRRDINRFIEFLGKKDVLAAGQDDVTRLIGLLKELGLVDTTIARSFSSLKSFFKFLLGEGYVTAQEPAPGTPLKPGMIIRLYLE